MKSCFDFKSRCGAGLAAGYLICSLLAPGVAAAQAGPVVPREIAVDADARLILPADSVTVTLLLEDTGKSAADALTALDARQEQVSKALEALNFGVTLALRGSHLVPAGTGVGASPAGSATNMMGQAAGGQSIVGQAGAGLTANSAVRAQRLLGVKTSQVKQAGAIVDTAMTAGAQRVLYVDYAVENAQEAQAAALKQATANARAKAETIAQSLGVKLGELLSATAAEDPEGNLARENMREGRDVTQFTEKEVRILANVRFAIQ